MALAKSLDTLLQEYGAEPGLTSDSWTQMMQSELSKAFTNSGYNAVGSPSTDGTPLRLENLDATMTSVLWTEDMLKFFQLIPRVPSIQPHYQFNTRLTYGGGRSSSGFAEGGTPKGGTSSYLRGAADIKFKGVRGGITQQALTTGLLGGFQIPPVEEENRNRTLELLVKIEREMMFGLGTITDESNNSVAYDGFMQQMGALAVGSGTVATANVIDKQGQPLTFEDLEEMAGRLTINSWVPSVGQHRLLMSPNILSDLNKIRLGTGTSPTTILRRGVDSPGAYTDGMELQGYRTQFGELAFDYSLFLERVQWGRSLLAANPEALLQAADAGAPTAPAAPTGVAANDATSLIPTASSFFYVAAAFNDSGESLGVVSAAAVTTTGTQAVTVTIPRVTTNNCTGYRLYRTKTGTVSGDSTGVNARWIADVPQPGGVGGSGNATYVDKNQIIPGAGMVIAVRPLVEDIALPQMSPLIKFPLAITSTTIEFLLLLYHTFVVKAPQRHFVIKNVGRMQPGLDGGQ